MFDLFHRSPAGYADLTPAEVQERVTAPDAPTLVDVRSPGEFAQGHIPGALLIPLSDLPARARELDRDGEVIVYCHSSARSRRAAKQLVQLGYSGVYNMSGGVVTWPYGLVR